MKLKYKPSHLFVPVTTRASYTRYTRPYVCETRGRDTGYTRPEACETCDMRDPMYETYEVYGTRGILDQRYARPEVFIPGTTSASSYTRYTRHYVHKTLRIRDQRYGRPKECETRCICDPKYARPE